MKKNLVIKLKDSNQYIYDVTTLQFERYLDKEYLGKCSVDEFVAYAQNDPDAMFYWVDTYLFFAFEIPVTFYKADILSVDIEFSDPQ